MFTLSALLTEVLIECTWLQLKTSFAKEDIPYCFWVFFPDGVLEGMFLYTRCRFCSFISSRADAVWRIELGSNVDCVTCSLTVFAGSRGSSLTSHGSPPSTIEPFLVDEKKVTSELLVFWIKKRLFAQQILSLNWYVKTNIKHMC